MKIIISFNPDVYVTSGLTRDLAAEPGYFPKVKIK